MLVLARPRAGRRFKAVSDPLSEPMNLDRQTQPGTTSILTNRRNEGISTSGDLSCHRRGLRIRHVIRLMRALLSRGIRRTSRRSTVLDVCETLLSSRHTHQDDANAARVVGISNKIPAVIGTRVESVNHAHDAALPLSRRTALDYSRQESVGLSK